MKYIAVLILSFLVIRCSPPVVFEEAYPTGEEDLIQIPDAYKGAFICESDSTIIYVSHRQEKGLTPRQYLELIPDPNGSKGKIHYI